MVTVVLCSLCCMCWCKRNSWLRRVVGMYTECVLFEVHAEAEETIDYWVYTRWFKCDRDKLWLVYTQIIPVIFEPPCINSIAGPDDCIAIYEVNAWFVVRIKKGSMKESVEYCVNIVVVGNGLDDLRFSPLQKQEICLLFMSKLAVGPTQPPVVWEIGSSFPGSKVAWACIWTQNSV
jgi:hypothetical protein